jgi:hypothetical protein
MVIYDRDRAGSIKRATTPSAVGGQTQNDPRPVTSEPAIRRRDHLGGVLRAYCPDAFLGRHQVLGLQLRLHASLGRRFHCLRVQVSVNINAAVSRWRAARSARRAAWRVAV